MKTHFLVLLLAILSPAFAETKVVLNIDPDFLCQSWTHSREEEDDRDDVQYFRPDSFKKFPPSRFRMRYVFAKDGTCKWMFLSPDDAHRLKDGQWTIARSDITTLQIVKGDTKETFWVVALTKDLLALKPVAAAK